MIVVVLVKPRIEAVCECILSFRDEIVVEIESVVLGGEDGQVATRNRTR